MSAAIDTEATPVTAPSSIAPGRRSRRRRFVWTSLALATIVIALWWTMLVVGDTVYTPAEIVAVIAGERVPGASFTVGSLRLPRAIVGVLAGAAFAVSGALFQTMLRNPLASPDIIGITSGSSAAAVFALVVLGWTGMTVSVVAVAAGLVVAAIITALANNGSSLGGRLILIGIGVGAMAQALVSYVLLIGATLDIPAAMRWLSGSLNGSNWDDVPILLAVVVLFGGLALVLGRDLGVLELGDQTAAALGVRVDRSRLLLILTGVVLAAFATAVTGPVSFVALLSPPIARRIAGSGGPLIIPAALVGAALVLVADLIGQFLLGTRYPVGVITGIVGAPYLILLLIRLNRSGGAA